MAGTVCRAHFDARPWPTQDEVAACDDCQAARRERDEQIQRDYTIDPDQPYGQHIVLTCANHRDMRWTTKNIDFIGARSIFYAGRRVADGSFDRAQPECSCSGADLVVVK
jgi:hypothetical protein